MLDTSKLVTNTALDIKFGEVENEIPDLSSLVTNTTLVITIREVENRIPNHDRYITTSEFNSFSDTILDERLKQGNLVTKADLDTVSPSTNKSEEKIDKFNKFDLSYFQKNIFGEYGS